MTICDGQTDGQTRGEKHTILRGDTYDPSGGDIITNELCNKGYKTFSCSAQLRLKILIINVKMPTIVGRGFGVLNLQKIYLGYFGIYEQDKF